MTRIQISQKIKEELEQKKLTAWLVKEGSEKNPFPVGVRAFYEAYRGRPISKTQRLLLEDYFSKKK
jgi:hypothetical protein